MSPKLFLSTLAVASLIGCGGGGGSDNESTTSGSTPPVATPAAPVATAAEGFWEGRTNTGRTVNAVVLEDGTYWALYSAVNDPSVLSGAIQGNGTTTPGSFSSTNGRDFSVEAESITNSTLSASYASKQFFNGTLTNQVSRSSITFTTSYSATYEQPASLVALTGSYAGTAATDSGVDRTTLSISSAGIISGTSESGCRFTGNASVHKAVNVYDLSITFQGGTCSNGTATTVGIAYLEGSNLFAAALDPARSNGFLITAAKR